MGRFRGRQHSEPLVGGESCPLCDARVPVGPDGRCRLGHRVREPGAAPPAPVPDEVHADAPAVQEDVTEAAESPVAVQEDVTEAAESPVTVQSDVGAAAEPVAPAPVETDPGQTDLVGAAPQPEPPPAAGPPALQDPSPVAAAAPWHPYDEVLAPGPRAPGSQRTPTSAPEAPTADASRSPLEDLLSWDEPMQSALDVSVEEAPAAAADVDAADPAPAPDEASPADDEASPAEGEASETGQTAHRGLSLLLGSGALALLALAAFALAAML